MMYIHYCTSCHKIHMLNGHKITCPKCRHSLSELKIPYMDYIKMGSEERDFFLKSCLNPDNLKSLCTTYRMYKYSKWYKDYLESLKIGQPERISAYISCDFRTTHRIKSELAV